MEKYRKEFPILRKGIYANTAVYGPMYDSLLEWRQEHDLDFLLHGSDMRSETLSTIAQTRIAIGKFFNCKRESVSLVNNFSTALNFLIESLDVKKKILLLENDYPTIGWAFESRGFTVHYIPISAYLEEQIELVVKKENIDILALSLVQWMDGFAIDLEFLKSLKITYPNLIIIADGTQFCGSVAFDFDASGIDVLGASAYKWFLAGYGNGFMLFSDAIINEVSVKSTGFNAAKAQLRNKENIRFAKRFEPGHLSSLNFGSLLHSINWFSQIGMEKITNQNRMLASKAKSEFLELGILDTKFAERKSCSTIFNIKADETTFQKLQKNDVFCAQRGLGVRLSFHFFNTEKDIDSIVDVLKKS